MTPIYEYAAEDSTRGCAHCRAGFETLQRMSDPPLTVCPECGGLVRRLISAPSVGASRTGFDHRAKSAGFHKLKRTGKGEYEKQY
jgi:putative FmdB family regulatory protein